MWRAAGLQMWINWCLYCQVVVPVISSDHRPSSSSSSPRKVQTIVFISSFLCAQLLFADRLICCGLGQVCEMWFEKETVQIGNVLIDWAGEVWAGAGGAPRMGPNVSCGLEFSRQPAPAPAHCPRTIRWFLIPFNWARWRWTAGRGATGWDNPAQPSRSQQTHSQIPSIHQHWLANMQCGLELETKVKRRFAKG